MLNLFVIDNGPVRLTGKPSGWLTPPAVPASRGYRLQFKYKMVGMPNGWLECQPLPSCFSPAVQPNRANKLPELSFLLKYFQGNSPRPGTFLPFGLGTRQCPGNDLAKLEVSIFLHHFLLGYK